MTRTIVALAAASTLTLSMALAQTATTPPAPSPSPPGMSQDMNKSEPAKAAAPSSKIVNAQKPDEWLATKFRGTEVIGPDGVKVGSVDDILFDREGHIKALVVGVGGFLGIGAKEVALGFKEFQIVPGKEGAADQLKLAMTKDELTAAAEFKPYEPPRPAATAPGGPGMGGAARRPMAPQ
jgi:sporulation protein YlmC with PRC-barrel domain